VDSSDLRKLVRLQAKQIAELEEQIEEFEERDEDEPEDDSAELRAELEGVREDTQRLVREHAASLRALADRTKERDDARRSLEPTAQALAEARKLITELRQQVAAATEVKLTFSQKCEIRENKIGDYLCESYKAHQKMQTPWWHVAKDMIKLLGVQFQEVE
jgi:chromosome segregation ATPase